MLKVLVISTMLLFSACSHKSTPVVKVDINKTVETKSDTVICKGYKEGVVCTAVYDPVCEKSVLQDHIDYKTASNPCTACTGKNVVSYTKGACPTFVKCKAKRPEVCTKEYTPVCAKVDTGIRCIKEPCPATEFKTFANGCTACSNPKVIGYMNGSCK